MSDANEEAAKIRTWLEKNHLYSAASWYQNKLVNDLKAAQIEADAAVPVLINLLTTETNSYFLSKVVWLAGLLKAETVVPQLVEILKNSEKSQVQSDILDVLTLLWSDKTIL